MQFPIELRKALIRNVARHGLSWIGNVAFLKFFDDLLDLKTLPSTDSRFQNAYDDMVQHTINNFDWSEADVLSDSRFNPLHMPDDAFERFVNKALHVDTHESPALTQLVEVIAPILKHDGLRIERHEIYGIFEGYRVRQGLAEQTLGRSDMRASQRMSLIDQIAGELQTRYSYNEITTYLGGFDFPSPDKEYTGNNSKRLFSVHALQKAPPEVLVAISEDLSVAAPLSGTIPRPANWRGTEQFRLFISHIAKHKDRATRLKECLAPYGIDAFVAHEDIQPTLEWQVEIERALHAMDAFLAIHTDGFRESFWTQQEVGFAVGRGVKIISFQMGEDPTGFISTKQALPRRNRSAEEIAAEIAKILAVDPMTSTKLSASKRPRDDGIPF